MKKFLLALFAIIYSLSFSQSRIVVLGVAQDGGYPHIGCERNCCNQAWAYDSLKRFVVSLALVDQNKKWWLFEATPDITEQLHLFRELTNKEFNFLPDGIFLTHAHMGHYTGLMQLGREALGSKGVPVYTLPIFKKYLENNGPWSQLVKLENIKLNELSTTQSLALSDGITITTFNVPHRDEFSETAGFKIVTPSKKYLFIPDIDKWSKFEKNIIEEVKSVDVAFLDASFYAEGEIPNRNMSEIPHPFVTETMELFKKESDLTKSKIYFIHFNHTNPLLFDHAIVKKIKQAGFRIAVQGSEY